MELIEKLYLRLNYHLESLSPSPEIIELMIKDATQLLEKEKEQIMNAYAENIDSMYPPEIGDEMCEDYYNETYKQD